MNKQRNYTIYRLKRCHVCGMLFNALRDSCPSCHEDTNVELVEKTIPQKIENSSNFEGGLM